MASKKLFIDTSALYAFIDRADPNHIKATATIEHLSVQGFFLYTSLQSVQDTYSTVNNKLGMVLSFEFIQTIMESNIEILCPQKSDLHSAFRLIRFNREKRISLKEALNSTLMEKRKIPLILTFSPWHHLLGSSSYSLNY